ncbi:TetR/AcrR family transcriptional regulator [Streptomyces parvulus]|uniref:TetR/AcrR family transcriptional regulator n=1 Tax=Streptomyces parvulus TaxID=146923 RepID=A0A369UUD8_9ACTN|nr:TetR/AcrR family transcriptional regulator [Streptomyces parvulus]RDD84374.1 TetR/AcrR family transcriptional regulator [Streptomyces parvulus]
MTGTLTQHRPGGGLRRDRVRLDISREASRLFLEQGLAATGGDQIARAVGVSTRTIWRHFRSKESCAEPVVAQGIRWEMASLRRWQPQHSLEDHLAAEFTRYARHAPAVERADHELAVRIVALAEKEPALRTAWLMACHQAEAELAEIISARLDMPVGAPEVQLLTAAAAGAIRVVNEEMADVTLRGVKTPHDPHMHVLLSRAVRNATGGAIGDPVAGSGSAGRHADSP